MALKVDSRTRNWIK